VLDSIRLWPTTPAILRDTTEPTSWETGTLAQGAAVVVFAPFFHRDDERLPYADSFAPELWLRGDSPERAPLVPFSEGPATYAGRNLVLLMTSALLAKLLAGARLRQHHPRALSGTRPLPKRAVAAPSLRETGWISSGYTS